MSRLLRTLSGGVKSRDSSKNTDGRARSFTFPLRTQDATTSAQHPETTSYRVYVKINLIAKDSSKYDMHLISLASAERTVPSAGGKINLSDIMDIELADAKTRNRKIKHKTWREICSEYWPLVHFAYADLQLRRDDSRQPVGWRDDMTRQFIRMDWESYKSRSVTTTPAQELKSLLESAMPSPGRGDEGMQAVSSDERDGSDDDGSSNHAGVSTAIDLLSQRSYVNTRLNWYAEERRLARSVSVVALSGESPAQPDRQRHTSLNVAEIRRGNGHIQVVYSDQWGAIESTTVPYDKSVMSA